MVPAGEIRIFHNKNRERQENMAIRKQAQGGCSAIGTLRELACMFL